MYVSSFGGILSFVISLFYLIDFDIRMYICMHVYVCIYLHVHRVYIHISIEVCMYLCMHQVYYESNICFNIEVQIYFK